MTNRVDGCQIWRGYQGTGFRRRSSTSIDVEDSPRAGGQYTITELARRMISYQDLDDSYKARLTTILIDQRRRGIQWPEVTVTLIEEAKNTPPLSVHKRADRLLQYLSNLISTVGNHATLGTPGPEPDRYGNSEVDPVIWTGSGPARSLWMIHTSKLKPR